MLHTTRFFLLAGAFILSSIPAGAQLTNSGQLVVSANGQLVLSGLSVVNQNAGLLTNQGIVSTNLHITNQNGGTLTGNGSWRLGGNWTNSGTFLAGASTVLFNGNTASLVSAGGAPFYHLHLDKNFQNLYLAAPVTANGNIQFVTGNNKIVCSGFDFTAGNTASISGEGPTAYFVTDGASQLKRLGLGAAPFTFPIGADTSRYNPLTLAENGAVDDIGVRCLPEPLTNGTGGAPISADAIAAAWEVTEQTSGGANLSATAQWVAADELPGFARTDCGVARFNAGTDWDLPPAAMGAAVGAGPYTRTRSNLSPGIFTVLDAAYLNRVRLAVRIMLQGPYNGPTMNMNDKLRTLANFPLTAPATYGAGKFTHSGWQPSGGYSIDPAVLSVSGNNAIVDWVFLWLKDPNNPATNLHTRAALLQRDGDVVDLDGVSEVLFPANAGNYIVGIGHRNHLSVRSPNGAGIALNETTVTSYDFTTSLTQAHGANPMKAVQTAPTAIYALWGGNTSVNNTVRATGPPAINDYTVILNTLGFPANVQPNVYSNADVNMDGTVRVTGPPAINDYSKLLNILGVPTAIITEQF